MPSCPTRFGGLTDRRGDHTVSGRNSSVIDTLYPHETLERGIDTMNHISAFARSALVAIPAALLMLCGCSVQPSEGGGESVGSATEEFDSTCTQAGADATWT